ncbi:ADP-ribose pyrophosphatase YjhB (NUDIX family) [Virgibacillus halotolerans]|uniref:NUDIX hydrolase n=1 Tax=Virgibacillus halotolerans TaxID=1071053 RepID=UPI00195FC40A|nr:NUDIX hydrolase [Virgibacillus halotolerans]MBM7601499.1 ADP-ribose pyrophosphatase YjhB (NUDIX family) [Virgibacillus halotolerans]
MLGSAGICVNDKNEVLMVLQGKPRDPNSKLWSVPSGVKDSGETLEENCIREVEEETGYKVKVVRKIFIKRGENDVQFEVHYFEVAVIGGKLQAQDPDDLIHKVEWKNSDEIKDLTFSYPEDREFLLRYLKDKS